MRELTEAQSKINSSPHYWDWFEWWWKEDYSWKGLEDKQTPNQVPLQTHYQHNSLALVERFGRQWHPVNCPYHDLNGAMIVNDRGVLQNARDTLNSLTEAYFVGIVKESNSINHRRGFKVGASDAQSINENNEKLNDINDSYLKKSISEGCRLENSVLDIATIISGSNTSTTYFDDCTFTSNSTISAKEDSTIIILNSKCLMELTIRANKVRIENLDARFLKIHPVAPAFKNSVNNFSVQVSIPKELDFYLEISHRANSTKKVQDAKINLTLENIHSVEMENINCDELVFYGDGLGNLSISNCSTKQELDLSESWIGKLNIINSSFYAGINAHKFEVASKCRILGTKIYSAANFNNAKFNCGLDFTPSTNSVGMFNEAVIANCDFEEALFRDTIKSRKSCSVNFNDTIFTGSASFNKAKFDGVPKFHNAKIHSETSFLDLGKIPDIDGPNIEKSEIYSSYQAAFRTLRQHMENNNSSAMAFEFGRREMIAKQRRTEYLDVPKSEILFTKVYGRLANYGQSFVKPMFLLLISWVVSMATQLVLFGFTLSECHILDKGCRPNWNLVGEAFERGSIFFIPPFTMLINRSIDSEAAKEINWFTDILSGAGMLLHALMASLLLFLVALGVKRRMQIR